MIDLALKFVMDQLNDYFNSHVTLTIESTSPVFLGNIGSFNDNDATLDNQDGKIMLWLVNLEEDRISKNPENFTRQGDQVIYRNPKIHLNLYCLFSIIRM